MGQAVLYAAVAASALVIGAAIGVLRPPTRPVTAALLAFAAGALITAVAFELFQEAYDLGGAWPSAVGLLAGASVFIVIDTLLERRKNQRVQAGSAVGLALLAAVTLDGVPENLAMGVALIESASPALLVAIFASNLPEAIVGAQKMREAGYERGKVVLIWCATGLLLAIPVVIGFVTLDGVSPATLAWPLAFAGGAVLASLADTLMPEAYSDGGPWVAWATAAGFLLSFLVSTA